MEMAVIFFSVYLGWRLGLHGSVLSVLEYKKFYLRAMFFSFVTISTFYIADLYNLKWFKRKREVIARILPCFIVIGVFLAFVGLVFQDAHFTVKSYVWSFLIFSPII